MKRLLGISLLGALAWFAGITIYKALASTDSTETLNSGVDAGSAGQLIAGALVLIGAIAFFGGLIATGVALIRGR